MSNHLLAAFVSLATLALVSCGAPSTPDFVKKAATSDLYEVEAGKIASDKGQRQRRVEAIGREHAADDQVNTASRARSRCNRASPSAFALSAATV